MEKLRSSDTIEKVRIRIVEQAIRIAETHHHNRGEQTLRRAIRIAIDIAGGAQIATDLPALKLATRELARLLRRSKSRNLMLANVSSWHSPLIDQDEFIFTEAHLDGADNCGSEQGHGGYLDG